MSNNDFDDIINKLNNGQNPTALERHRNSEQWENTKRGGTRNSIYDLRGLRSVTEGSEDTN